MLCMRLVGVKWEKLGGGCTDALQVLFGVFQALSFSRTCSKPWPQTPFSAGLRPYRVPPGIVLNPKPKPPILQDFGTVYLQVLS